MVGCVCQAGQRGWQWPGGKAVLDTLFVRVLQSSPVSSRSGVAVRVIDRQTFAGRCRVEIALGGDQCHRGETGILLLAADFAGGGELDGVVGTQYGRVRQSRRLVQQGGRDLDDGGVTAPFRSPGAPGMARDRASGLGRGRVASDRRPSHVPPPELRSPASARPWPRRNRPPRHARRRACRGSSAASTRSARRRGSPPRWLPGRKLRSSSHSTKPFSRTGRKATMTRNPSGTAASQRADPRPASAPDSLRHRDATGREQGQGPRAWIVFSVGSLSRPSLRDGTLLDRISRASTAGDYVLADGRARAPPTIERRFQRASPPSEPGVDPLRIGTNLRRRPRWARSGTFLPGLGSRHPVAGAAGMVRACHAWAAYRRGTEVHRPRTRSDPIASHRPDRTVPFWEPAPPANGRSETARSVPVLLAPRP